MEKIYDPHAIETRWYERWESQGYFEPTGTGPAYCIMIPPPNVTGSLHMGHAFQDTIMDALTRFKRMDGHASLWQPGSDHAGIATQMVVERQLQAQGTDRQAMGREAFVERVWQWKDESGGTISRQLRRLGTSLDWAHERFTMDEGLSAAVLETFVRLHEEGLIYRGKRLVNWDPILGTAISDLEVVSEEEDGFLWHLRYPVADHVGSYVVVATTRPETMLGDTAVAVHPADERYQDLIGKSLELPLTGRIIPMIADDYVDPGFGSGCVKITPAHDFNDYAVGQRHGLEMVNIFTSDARINENGPTEYQGLDRYEARAKIVEALKTRDLLERQASHKLMVPRGDRTQSVIEPYLTDQWFVRTEPLAKPAIEAVESGAIRFVPPNWEKTYFEWMHNIEDWCISRQLWWGHRIPAWYDLEGDVYVGRSEAEVRSKHGLGKDLVLTQDDDVLDTWFSSALWPFSTLGWPEDTDDLRRFYPTSVLVTGYDIISFWVARMMKMGLHFTESAPFSDIVIHGLIRSADDGRKMSKSSGNAVDPLDLVARYGADSLRLALLKAAAPGHDIPFDEEWVDAARRFGNKLWNASRFVIEYAGAVNVPVSGGYPDEPGPEDAWVLSRLAAVTAEYDRLSDEYRYSDAVGLLYNFAWSEVFDWYLEMAKTALRDDARAETTRQTLGVVLRDLIKLFHPIIPFVTEELWKELGDGSLLITARWPEPPTVQGPGSFDELRDLVVGVRRFRSDHQLSPRTSLTVLLDDPDEIAESWWLSQLEGLARVSVASGRVPDSKAGHARVAAGRVQAVIPLAGLIDVAAERPRLEKAIADTTSLLDKSLAKLANASFLDRAPAEVVSREEAKATEHEARLEKLSAQLAELG